MILYYKNRKIKLIPSRYKDVKNATDYLENFEHIRLSKEERFALDKALFNQNVESFINSIRDKEPLVFEQIKDAQSVCVFEVSTNDGQVYYSMKMDNNINVRCPKNLYDLCHDKREVKYAVSLSSQIAPPSALQLSFDS